MDPFKAIKLKAARSVWNSKQDNPKDDDDYVRFRIVRWYSKTFHTPLSEVEDLPFIEVFEAFTLESYEDLVNSQDPNEPANLGKMKLMAEIRRLIETPEEAAERQKLIDIEEADLFEMMENDPEMKAQKQEEANLDKKVIVNKMVEALTPIFRNLENSLPSSDYGPLPPISVDFDDDDDVIKVG